MNDFGISRFLSELAVWVYGTTSITILVGLVVFLLTLWILPMTKWGRTNPVAKCVGLSVLAHVLLLCYAYGTSLITEIPIHHPPSPVPVRIATKSEIITETDADSESKSEASSKPFWRQIDQTQPSPTIAQSTSAPQRQTADKVQPTERQNFLPTAQEQDSVIPESYQSVPKMTASQNAQSSSQVDTRTLAKNRQESNARQHSPSSGSESISNVAASRYFKSENSFETSKFSGDKWLQDHLSTPGLKRQIPTTKNLNSQLVDAGPDFGSRNNDSSSSWDITKGDQINRPGGLATSSHQNQNGSVGSKLGQPLVSNRNHSASNSTAAKLVSRKSRPSVYRRIVDGQEVPKRYHNRFQKDPKKLLEAGATPASEKAVQKALAYLARVQKADGSFDPRSTEGGKEKNVYGHNRRGAGAQADTGITGLAILAWMANGNTHLEGPYKENVRSGLNYLIKRQQKNGSLAGSAQFFAQMYCHSMALLAISEAYCLTGDPELAEPLKRAVDYSQRSQNRVGGGWRYRPGEQGDMSQFGWQVMALVSARIAGTPVDRRTEALMDTFLKNHSVGKHKGLAIYRYREQPSSTMTAEALFCRFLLKQKVPAATIVEACDKIVERRNGRMDNLPSNSGNNLYFWYYGTLALHQASKEAVVKNNQKVQQAWKSWNKTLQEKLTKTQQIGGRNDGSWDPDKFLWGCYGGRVYTTSMAVLSLQIYYRYDLERNQPRPQVAGRVTDQIQRQ